jgi:hypothetical protein
MRFMKLLLLFADAALGVPSRDEVAIELLKLEDHRDKWFIRLGLKFYLTLEESVDVVTLLKREMKRSLAGRSKRICIWAHIRERSARRQLVDLEFASRDDKALIELLRDDLLLKQIESCIEGRFHEKFTGEAYKCEIKYRPDAPGWRRSEDIALRSMHFYQNRIITRMLAAGETGCMSRCKVVGIKEGELRVSSGFCKRTQDDLLCRFTHGLSCMSMKFAQKTRTDLLGRKSPEFLIVREEVQNDVLIISIRCGTEDPSVAGELWKTHLLLEEASSELQSVKRKVCSLLVASRFSLLRPEASQAWRSTVQMYIA